MTDFDLSIFYDPRFMWCPKHQCSRRVSFVSTAPTAVCDKCEAKFNEILNTANTAPNTPKEPL